MEVKEGYKKTEMGVIPGDWEVKTLNEVSISISSGKSLTKSQSSGSFPILGSTGIIGYSTNYDYKGKRILVARVGANAGTVNFIYGNYCVSDNTLMVSLKSDVNFFFILFFLNFSNLNKLVFGSGQPLITGGQLKQLLIRLPPLPEQTAIAAVLSDTDNLIQALEKKIAKKELIKKGAMQQLLEPKEGWERKTMSDVCEIRKGQLITSSTRTDGNIPVIAGGKTPAYYHKYPNRTGKTITISASGANAGYVSFHNYPIFASDCSTISESNNYSIEYIYFILIGMQNSIYKMQTGGAQPHIHPKDINPIIIPFPSISEQTHIAQILSDIDNEIESLQEKLSKYKQLKQGLMQELLTGRIRLV